MLCDVHDVSRLNFTRDFTNTELGHKIIEIYDLKTNGMIDTKVLQKFIKNHDFLEQMFRQEE